MRFLVLATTTLVLLCLVVGCDPGAPDDTDPGDPPATPALIASAATVLAGDPVSLLPWFAGGEATLAPDLGEVQSGVPVVVTPAATTEYTLTVTNEAGTETAATTVTVVEGAALTVTLDGALPTTPVVWVFGPDGSVSTLADGATLGDLLPGTWSVAAPNVPEAGLLYVASIDPPSVTLEPGGAATVAVSYAASDTPPSIEPIPATGLVRAASNVIPFTVRDLEEQPAALSVTVIADGPLGLDPDDLVLGGAGALRTLTIATPDEPGHAMITLTVADSRGHRSNASFLVGISALVTSTADTGPGTLRAANAEGATVIEFSPALGAPIVLSSGPIAVARPVFVVGSPSAPVPIQGGDTQGIFDVLDGGELDLSGLELSHARQAVRVERGGRLRVADCALVDNTADNGAAIDNAGVVEVERTLFARNVSDCGGSGCGTGGGAVVQHSGETGSVSFRAVDSTFSGNVARSMGGAIGSALFATSGDVFLERCTITENACEGGCSGGAVFAGGDFIMPGPGAIATVDVRGSIVAGNTGGSPADIRQSVSDQVWSGGFNVLGDVSGFDLGEGDVAEVVDPLLTTLGDHGGPLPTHVPLPGSPALARVPVVALDGATEDARGEPRRANAVLLSDSGAVERQDDDPTVR